jgi:hypothetical protein
MSESIQSVVVGYILNKSVALREKPIALIEQAKVWMRPLLPERHGEKRQSVATLRPRQLLIAAGSSASLAGATIGERLRPKVRVHTAFGRAYGSPGILLANIHFGQSIQHVPLSNDSVHLLLRFSQLFLRAGPAI